MQITMFFILGLLATPSHLLQVLIPSLLVFLLLSFVARPLSIFGLLSFFKRPFNQSLLVSFAGLRGASSIVFAITAVVKSEAIDNSLFDITFVVVLLSILLQGSLLPQVSCHTNMVDQDEDVRKTFNEFVENLPLQYMQFKIGEFHFWREKSYLS